MDRMRKSKFTEEQIAMALRQGEAGTPVADICRKLGISQATYFRWRKHYGSLGVPELRELRQLRDENRRLKALVADLSLDKTILQEALQRNIEPRLYREQSKPTRSTLGRSNSRAGGLWESCVKRRHGRHRRHEAGNDGFLQGDGRNPGDGPVSSRHSFAVTEKVPWEGCL
jgi:putative transposase